MLRGHRSMALFLAAFLAALAAPLPSMANEGGRPRFVEPAPTRAERQGGPGFLDRLLSRGSREEAARPARNRPAVRPARKSPAPQPARRVPRPVFVPRESAPGGAPPDGEARFAPDQVIVRYQLNAPQARMNALVARLNLRHEAARTFRLAGITAHRYTIVSGQPVRAVIAALEADPVVVYAQPNYLYRLQQAQARAAAPQYALARLALEPVRRDHDGRGIRIAVLDSLVDRDHPELAGAALTVVDLTGTGEADAHGTSVAGILAARGTLEGVAPASDILAVGVFWKDREGRPVSDSWTIGRGLDEAGARDASILNLSFAGPRDPLLENGLKGAERRGMVTLAAAGNDGPEAGPLFPAAYESAIAVTAIDEADRVYERANRGAYLELAAPGVDILALAPGKRFGVVSGTSLATAHVTGLAALLLQARPGLSAAHLRSILRETASDLGAPGPDAVFGAGRPDAGRALAALSPH
ncbi:S8 family serine peptidase [Zhengella sp. ZM62]|uniref:S8 family serine peptidase n=1 Tax=Zhengella sedimenti TaxID=3390035 RepID=UPI003976088F